MTGQYSPSSRTKVDASLRRTTFDQSSEPPPSPLATIPPMPRNDQTSKTPCSPSLGSQKLCAMSHGVRGNEPGGYALPRSRTRTDMPASARRNAVTDPPNPEPTTTAS